MSNLISRSEAQFRLRNIGAKIALAVSASREGDWQDAFSHAWDAKELLDQIVPHLEEASGHQREFLPNEPEPLGSLKYGTPPSIGGMGYRGSNHSSSQEPSRPIDVTPPKPINLPKVIITPPPPPPPKPIITPPPLRIPEGAEVITLDIEQASIGIITDATRKTFEQLDSLPTDFRKKVLMAHALSRRPVTIWRNNETDWRIHPTENK